MMCRRLKQGFGLKNVLQILYDAPLSLLKSETWWDDDLELPEYQLLAETDANRAASSELWAGIITSPWLDKKGLFFSCAGEAWLR